MWELLMLALMEHLGRRRVAASRRAVFAANERLYYRTRDGLADYRFSIERQSNGTYRSYIIDQPYYVTTSNAAATHRIADANGRLFICWSEPLRSTADARRVSAAWADSMQQHVRTGRAF
jgi:hypothetical protein